MQGKVWASMTTNIVNIVVPYSECSCSITYLNMIFGVVSATCHVVTVDRHVQVRELFHEARSMTLACHPFFLEIGAANTSISTTLSPAQECPRDFLYGPPASLKGSGGRTPVMQVVYRTILSS